MTPKSTSADLCRLALCLCSLLLLLGGCSSEAGSTKAHSEASHTGESGEPDSGKADTGDQDSGVTDSGGADTSPPSDPWFGEALSPPIALPDFQALHTDETPRSLADLLGHPTVLWFFREAGGST